MDCEKIKSLLLLRTVPDLLCVFFGLQIVHLLVEETSRYEEYINTLDEGQCSMPGRL